MKCCLSASNVPSFPPSGAEPSRAQRLISVFSARADGENELVVGADRLRLGHAAHVGDTRVEAVEARLREPQQDALVHHQERARLGLWPRDLDELVHVEVLVHDRERAALVERQAEVGGPLCPHAPDVAALGDVNDRHPLRRSPGRESVGDNEGANRDREEREEQLLHASPPLAGSLQPWQGQDIGAGSEPGCGLLRTPHRLVRAQPNRSSASRGRPARMRRQRTAARSTSGLRRSALTAAEAFSPSKTKTTSRSLRKTWCRWSPRCSISKDGPSSTSWRAAAAVPRLSGTTTATRARATCSARSRARSSLSSPTRPAPPKAVKAATSTRSQEGRSRTSDLLPLIRSPAPRPISTAESSSNRMRSSSGSADPCRTSSSSPSSSRPLEVGPSPVRQTMA